MKKIYTAFLMLFVLLSISLMYWFPFGKNEPRSILEEQSALLSSLLPMESEPAEIAVPFAQNVPAAVLPNQTLPRKAAPPKTSSPAVQTVQQPGTDASSPSGAVVDSVADAAQGNVSNSVPYFFFYTSVPVRFPQATNTFIYTTTGFAPMPAYLPVTPMPVMQSYSVPVFYPRVVPTRVGAPRLVYSNGVVIKPKVYFPNQPVRNTLRFIGR